MDYQLVLAAFIIPAFWIFLGLEYWAARRKKMEHVFNYENAVTNISVGIAERLLNLLITGSFYALFICAYHYHSGHGTKSFLVHITASRLSSDHGYYHSGSAWHVFFLYPYTGYRETWVA